MAPPDLEDRILDIVRSYNERNEPVGKKMIYDMHLATITTVLKTIKSLEADGKLVEHMITLPRGTFCMLMIPTKDNQPKEEVIRQHIADMTLFQVRRNGEMLEKILKNQEATKHDAVPQNSL